MITLVRHPNELDEDTQNILQITTDSVRCQYLQISKILLRDKGTLTDKGNDWKPVKQSSYWKVVSECEGIIDSLAGKTL